MARYHRETTPQVLPACLPTDSVPTRWCLRSHLSPGTSATIKVECLKGVSYKTAPPEGAYLPPGHKLTQSRRRREAIFNPPSINIKQTTITIWNLNLIRHTLHLASRMQNSPNPVVWTHGREVRPPAPGKGGVEKRGQSCKAVRDMAMHGGCGKSLIEFCLLSISCTVPNAELMQGRFSGANWDFFALLFVWGVGVGGWAAAAVIGSGGW